MNPISPYESQIDAALQVLARVQPTAGLSDRVNKQLASLDHRASASRVLHFRVPYSMRVALGSVAAGLAAAAILVGSIQHSHRIAVMPHAVRMQPSGGIGAAGAERVTTGTPAPSPTQPGRNVQQPHRGRAVVSPDAHKAPGVSVPKPPDQP